MSVWEIRQGYLDDKQCLLLFKNYNEDMYIVNLWIDGEMSVFEQCSWESIYFIVSEFSFKDISYVESPTGNNDMHLTEVYQTRY